jgi:threonine/homoserine/homoserine lactone efflux protein
MEKTLHHQTYSHAYPSLTQIRDTADRLVGKILHTPVWHWQTGIVEDQFKGAGEVWLKLELFQKTGTFKLRGALNCIEALDDAARRRGVVAVSAGNHAMAVAYTARLVGCSAKVVMPQHASPARIAACREQGAQVLLMPDVHQAFARGREIERDEVRTMLHPYDGPLTAQGTATVGLELMAQVPGLEAVVVAVQTYVTCVGLGSLFVAYPVLHQILRVAGALYLVVLAWKLSGSALGQARASKPLSFAQAALFQAVNPKSWVKSITLATVFMPVGLSVPMGALLVTVIGLLIGFPSSSMWALFGVAIRRLLTDPRKQRIFNLSMSAVLLVLAVSFLR